MAGLFYEQLTPGLVIQHAVTRTVTEADNVLFTAVTMNPQPLHLDATFAASTEFGQRVVNGFLTLAIIGGISVYEISLGTTLGNLGMTDIRFPNPVFHGDTIRAETEIRSRRLSKSREDAGVVEFEHRGYKQTGQLICVFRRHGLMKLESKMATALSASNTNVQSSV